MALTQSQIAKADNGHVTDRIPVFTTGVEFTVINYEYVAINESSNNYYVALVCKVGDIETPISVLKQIRPRPVKPYKDEDGNEVRYRTPSGTFHDYIRKTLAEYRGKNDKETLTAIVNGLKDKTLVVREVEQLITEDPRYGEQIKPMVHIDFKD